MRTNNPTRTLARSVAIQSLYRSMKDGIGFNFFSNTTDLTLLQREFLMWVKIYSFLQEEMSKGHPLLSDKVLNHDVWVDAFLVWHEKNHDIDIKTLKRRKHGVICRG
jgi:hypothetical protein